MKQECTYRGLLSMVDLIFIYSLFLDIFISTAIRKF
nr:MAG TPA: hypothetical protein [Caudoviricetes sp.]